MQNQLAQIRTFLCAMHGVPAATATLRGSDDYPTLRATALFHQTKHGVLVTVLADGLPEPARGCDAPVFALHIHKGGACTGERTDPFKDALTHYNPDTCDHPWHAGDLAPLFGAHGTAFSVQLSDRFTVQEVIGRTLVIHRQPDDFTSQPAGNAGAKIACGCIVQTLRRGG